MRFAQFQGPEIFCMIGEVCQTQLNEMLVTLYLLTAFGAFFNAFLFLLYSMIRVKVKNRIVLNIVSWPMACYVCSVFWQPMCIRNFVITKFY